MAANSKKSEEEDSGEFADFMADISQEIAQRVESLDAAPKAQPEPKKATPLPRDAGLILEWENLPDRMIEEMR
ncbi:MAG TPA: hypothetical protein VK516_12250 [Gemmatimonadaceae bacterium]|jgi:hypothetical protein|nr:hypothetical protein [Gemmatimonadaceae bacterium]HMI46499.1 hypothetical protein [Gemmatimonadaceae bacterium]